jgi:general stress protein 26
MESTAGSWARVFELIGEIRVALLTSLDAHGRFHTRPLQTMQVGTDRTLWFFTAWNSPKVRELDADVRVSVAYADLARHVYVTVAGTATLLRDAQKAKELWSLEQRAYYPDGPSDARLALLRVDMEQAEYWLAPGPLSYLVAAAKATLSGTPVEIVGVNREAT